MNSTEKKEVVEVAPTLPEIKTNEVVAKPATKPVSKKNETKKVTVKKSLAKKKDVAAKPVAKKKNVVVAKAPTEEKNGKIEMVNIFSTTYGYYRYFIKVILAEGGISKFRFVKDAESYNGKIAVAKTEVQKATKILADYKTKNPDTVEMWS